MLKFMIGADPELFVKDSMGNNLSAHDLIPGTKEEPYRVDGGAIQVDGTALEFNINAAGSLAEFTGNIQKVLNNLSGRVEGGAFSDRHIVFEPTAIYRRDYFENLPELARLMGCMPDFNAYTGTYNNPPETDEPFRTAGGHIHIGWRDSGDPMNGEHFDKCIDAVKQLDAVLYPASMLWDSDDKRRELYGAKGAFRPKEYGVEYRPLSCAWVASQKTQEFVYNTTQWAMDLLFNKGVRLYA